jgi:hypothetical protein
LESDPNVLARINIEQPKGSDSVAFELPFDGDLPDSLKNKVFHGEAFFLTDGSRDVAEKILFMMNNVVDSE